MGGLLHLVQRGGAWATGVTTLPSGARVQIIILTRIDTNI